MAIIGIDLGTTFSAVGTMTADGPRLIRNAVGDLLTPSAVGVDAEGRVVVGREAKDFQVTQPERCADLFKRQMGSNWTATLGHLTLSPEQLSSLVVKSLKEDAEAQLGEPVEQAVISVPAYFNEHQRKATIRAGEMAELKVERILNEPTAAAIAYGFHESREEKTLAVVDLGGGTFDVSIVELFDGMVEVRASSGDSFLGGEDFTVALMSHMLKAQGIVYERAELEAPAMVSRLRRLSEVAKRRLSREPRVEVRIPNAQGEVPEHAVTLPVTREQFDEWTEYLLRRLGHPIRRAVSDADLRPENVDEVVLVGGATRMPAVIRFVEQLFGKPARQRLHPGEVVALGASVQAGLIARDAALEDLVVTDVAPFTLGVETSKDMGAEYRPGYMLPIIHRNTTIPISRVKRVTTVHPHQREVSVRVFQGESRKVEGNLLLGEFAVKGIPPGPPGQEVDIRFTYDLNGVLEVEATVVATSKTFSHVITRLVTGMSAAQVRRAVAEMQKLKTTRREDAANRAVLRQADRLYRELPFVEQRMLGELLDAFETALEMGDRAMIADCYLALSSFLAAHDEDYRQEDGASQT